MLKHMLSKEHEELEVLSIVFHNRLEIIKIAALHELDNGE
tara:strand:- start:858 stop:977 length:120 start_codon:yes stop_codon:yes gene_type:complete